MPSIIDQIRAQQAWEQPKKASPWPLMLGVLGAFLIGGGGVYVWKLKSALPDAISTVAAVQPERKAEASFAGDGPRVGRAETAPLLKTCVARGKLGLLGAQQLEPSDLYRILQQGTDMTRLAAIAGAKKGADQSPFLFLWTDVADCIYRQNGWALCDPDNRALAVEAVSALSRQVATSAPAKPDKQDAATLRRYADNQYQLQSARAVKDRVLAALRNRVEEGRLIAADFGIFTHEDVRQVLRSVTPARNACAERS